MTTAIKHIGDRFKEAMSCEKIQACQNCGNRYIIIWLTQGMDYNDFGLRHCPFCGLLTDEMTGGIVV
jgi:hypothetical protein